MTLYEGTHEDKNIARMLIEEYISSLQNVYIIIV
jgi:hypothetical protein